MHRIPGGRQSSMTSDQRCWSGSGAVSSALAVEPAQREQREKGSPPAEVLTVLPVEGAGEDAGVGGGRVALGAACAAAALATPPHRVALAREAEPMAEQATTEHHGREYSDTMAGVGASPG